MSRSGLSTCMLIGMHIYTHTYAHTCAHTPHTYFLNKRDVLTIILLFIICMGLCADVCTCMLMPSDAGSPGARVTGHCVGVRNQARVLCKSTMCS